MSQHLLTQLFRQAVPYINMHRGKTFVVMLGGETIAAKLYLSILNDIALLHSLGIQLILVYGARPQINQALLTQHIEPQFHQGVRISDQTTLNVIRQVCGALQFDITARLSMGLSNTPMHGAQVNVVSGNFVIAQPIGVVDGVDYCLSGRVRKLDIAAIEAQLAERNIVLLGPVAVSVTGESFNLTAEEIATQVAIRLKADKMIGFGQHAGVLTAGSQLIPEMLPSDVLHYLQNQQTMPSRCAGEQAFLKASIEACRRGVPRCHFISYQQDGALLEELFSREGVGTQIVTESAEKLRCATINDISGVLDLIRPLEMQGALVRRSREQLEMEIEQFVVIEVDQLIIGCAALYPFAQTQAAEFACLAVHPDYREGSRGDHLLQKVIEQARRQGVTQLFALTTTSIHWFLEHGFVMVDVDCLPDEKKQLYNYQRRSKVLMLSLS